MISAIRPRKVKIGYRDIWKLSFPIILGSATQNVIVLSDSVFLYGRSESEFAAIGFVSVFYLLMTAIGFGFSKGGQILISRRYAESNEKEVGILFQSMLFFELILAFLLFLGMQFLAPLFFDYLLETPGMADLSMEYIRFRSWGIFFSFTGISLIAYYSGISKTKIIAIDTIILTIVNLVLNYSLIFGKWGMPEMGIAGAGLASTLAEIIAFVVFVVYLVWDKDTRAFGLFRWHPDVWDSVPQMLRVSFPFVIQFICSIGSWLFFFGMIENLGQRAMAISTLVRIIYVVLSIPTWGMATGVQTLVSQCIGAGNPKRVILVTNKTVALNLAITLMFALPVLLVPWQFWMHGALLDRVEMALEARHLFPLILGILVFFASGSIYHSAFMSAGELWAGLRIQILVVVIYLVSAYLMINVWHVSLAAVWSLELFYWLALGCLSVYLLYRGRWMRLDRQL